MKALTGAAAAPLGSWQRTWKLAEDGHAVTIVTPDPMVGKELQRSATDWPLRRTLAQFGVRFITDAAICEWNETGAVVQSLLTNLTEHLAADSLVLATTNVADASMRHELAAMGITTQLIGDANAPRNAAMALFEGRKAGLAA